MTCDAGGVGNLFTAHGSSATPDELQLSNGSTDVLFDVLTIAGSALAQTPWQHNLVLHFADGHRHSRGFSGFDLSEVPWTVEYRGEKEFFLRMIELALRPQGVDRLRSTPPS